MLRRTLALQLDPYTMTPLWPDTVSLAGLQARAGIDAGVWDERAMAEVANRSLTDAEKNEYAIRKGGSSVEELLARPMYADPLRKHDCAPVTDGAAAIVLAAGDRARERARPAGLDHRPRAQRRPDEHGHPRPDPLALGRRARQPALDLDRRRGRRAARAVQPPGADPAHASSGWATTYAINPSGGALDQQPDVLRRPASASARPRSGSGPASADKALGHATSGPGAAAEPRLRASASEGTTS